MLVYQRVAGHHCDIFFRVVPVEVCDGVMKVMPRNDTVDVVSDFSGAVVSEIYASRILALFLSFSGS